MYHIPSPTEHESCPLSVKSDDNKADGGKGRSTSDAYIGPGRDIPLPKSGHWLQDTPLLERGRAAVESLAPLAVQPSCGLDGVGCQHRQDIGIAT